MTAVAAVLLETVAIAALLLRAADALTVLSRELADSLDVDVSVVDSPFSMTMSLRA